ncbi:MAG: hypothetical protein GF401_18010 [Chitinivibrionales bacterium]|nr:hypothetical protein [Chitinivibrionales bacterium]
MPPMKERSSERIESLNVDPDRVTFFDLSKTGVCCLYKKKLEKGAVVSVKINDLQLKARVIYAIDRKDGARTGLQFIDTSPEIQKELNTLVEGFSRGIPVSCAIIEDSNQ